MSMNNVETLRNANLPPAFYCWGTRHGFSGQFTQNANAVEHAGCCVKRKILQNYPHGYGTSGSHEVWGRDFDTFLSGIMSGNSAINNVEADIAKTTGKEVMYDLYGRQVPADTAKSGIYIVKNAQRPPKYYNNKCID